MGNEAITTLSVWCGTLCRKCTFILEAGCVLPIRLSTTALAQGKADKKCDYRQAGNNVSLALGATEMRDNRERARPSTHCKRILRNKCIAMVAMVDLDSPSSP